MLHIGFCGSYGDSKTMWFLIIQNLVMEMSNEQISFNVTTEPKWKYSPADHVFAGIAMVWRDECSIFRWDFIDKI